MTSLHHLSKYRDRDPPCCRPADAWALVREISWWALRGEVAPHVLAGAVDHALRMNQLAGVAR